MIALTLFIKEGLNISEKHTSTFNYAVLIK